MAGTLDVDRIGRPGELGRGVRGRDRGKAGGAPPLQEPGAGHDGTPPRRGGAVFGLRLGKCRHSKGRVEEGFAGPSGGGGTVKASHRAHRKLLSWPGLLGTRLSAGKDLEDHAVQLRIRRCGN